jgi:hypothetical protein
MIDQKQTKNLEYYNYFCTVITNDARCMQEIKSKIFIAKAAFNKKKASFQEQI